MLCASTFGTPGHYGALSALLVEAQNTQTSQGSMVQWFTNDKLFDRLWYHNLIPVIGYRLYNSLYYIDSPFFVCFVQLKTEN